MDRDLDREDGAPVEHPEQPRDRESRPLPNLNDLSRAREVVKDRNRVWHISPAERRTLQEIGRFRTVAIQDLLRLFYSGREADLRADFRSLSPQGLIRRREAPMRFGKRPLEVVVLTSDAKRLLERDPERAEAVYAGFVKPSEVAHDAAIYRMFHAEKQRIEAQGGRVRRVVLDYELKRKTYAPLAKARQISKAEFSRRQRDVARLHGLTIVKGRLVLPDLRIEYDTADGRTESVDLELATGHYHGSHLRAKAQAGFKFYVADGSANRLSRIFDDHHIAADLLSL